MSNVVSTGSVARVEAAARRAGLPVSVKRMGTSTRTAAEAAAQCGCSEARIIKSLIFQGAASKKLYLFLVPGDRMLDLARAAALTGEAISRADPRHVRDITGFAIGGVSPIGHLAPIAAFADASLLEHQTIWAAAGASDAVFEAEPAALIALAKAKIADLTA